MADCKEQLPSDELSDAEVARIATTLHHRLKDDFGAARKWFWAAVGAAAAAGIGQIASLLIAKHFH